MQFLVGALPSPLEDEKQIKLLWHHLKIELIPFMLFLSDHYFCSFLKINFPKSSRFADNGDSHHCEKTQQGQNGGFHHNQCAVSIILKIGSK